MDWQLGGNYGVNILRQFLSFNRMWHLIDLIKLNRLIYGPLGPLSLSFGFENIPQFRLLHLERPNFMAVPRLKIPVETCFIFYDMLPTHTHALQRLHVKIEEANIKKNSEFQLRVAEDVTCVSCGLGSFSACGNRGRAN